MQADAKHEKHHADFSELAGQAFVGDRFWRKSADKDARDEVPDERRQTESVGKVSQRKRDCETDSDGADQGNIVHLWRARSQNARK